ncbi:hypothetical protein ACA910_002193 [Epithemia clementina (nom. ined.)]
MNRGFQPSINDWQSSASSSAQNQQIAELNNNINNNNSNERSDVMGGAGHANATSASFSAVIQGVPSAFSFSSPNVLSGATVAAPNSAFNSSTAASIAVPPPLSSFSAASTNSASAFAAAVAAAGAVAPAAYQQSQQEQLQDELSQLPAMRARMRGYMDGVIRSTMPPQQSQAYTEAVEHDANLVLTETDPLQFLRCCNYDIWKGSERLCRYWTERKKLFGPQRAFLPLTLTGTGALTHDDVHTIFAGYPAILPDTTDGRKCLLEDRNNWVDGASEESKIRAWFYVMKILAKDDRCQTEGMLIGLVVTFTPRNRDMDWTFLRRVAYLNAQVFPVKGSSGHFLGISTHRKRHMAAAVAKTAVDICRHLCPAASLRVHLQTEPNEILNELTSAGFIKKGIPLMFGGKWKVDDWYQWCQIQKEWEKKVYRGRLLKEPPSRSSATLGNPRFTNSSPVSACTGASGVGAFGSPTGAGGVASSSPSDFTAMFVSPSAGGVAPSSSSGLAAMFGSPSAGGDFAAMFRASAAFPGEGDNITVIHSNMTSGPMDIDHVVGNYGVLLSTTDEQRRQQEDQERKMEQEKQEKARRDNVLRARRERQRKRIELESLKLETTQLGLEKDRLLAEHARLNRLLGEANDVLDQRIHF